ncbi:putative ABC transporter ATP-binding protein YxlF [Planctomycetes bacterium Poly30]|uniref:Putative ABC transporter ATP-binding protein YxlF n=1 Tax=Saltatorellus ferox TaxID=2528018 RepID=A0A518ERY2_9BACT|nr:putative ABC transporter ATP-binding protein YxlF [Planctomycetes bacterium Poly30]
MIQAAMIQAEGLSKSFGSVRAVRQVSFEVARGELVGFLGPNGAGKSTTMKMLTGSLLPDEGRATVAGVPLDGRSIGARAAVGYLPEHTPLYREMRVHRYLDFVGQVHGMGRRKRRDAFDRVVDACDLEGYTDRRIHTLSKGYRQRVGLAQALFADPEVLILDEPTSGLDPGEIVRIRDLVVRLARSKTIMLSTHVLPEVEEVCHRVVIIAGGQLVADGAIGDLSEGLAAAISVTVVAEEAELLRLLGDLPGASRPRIVARGDAGRLRAMIEVEDRFEVAARASRTLHDRGFEILELRHEVPTLERVFLERTRMLGSATVDPDETSPGRTENTEVTV